MRLIDAEALEESIEQIEWYHLARNGEMVKGAAENGWYKEQDIYNAIKEAPVIEAKPVVHAHWEPKKIMARTPFARNYYCSNCKDEPLECKHICGNCGAQMDEKEDKHEDYT